MKHIFYISKKENTKADINNLDNIMILFFLTKDNLYKILNYYKIQNKKTDIINIGNIQSIYNINIKFHIRVNLTIYINEIIYTILNNIDNKKTTKEIFDIVRSDLDIDLNDSEILKIFQPVYNNFELYDMILLKSNKF